MQALITLFLPGLVAVLLVRLLLLPLRGILKIAIHAVFGFLCLWLLNRVSSLTGIALPINAATVLISGFLGLPGIGLLAILAVL